MLVEAPQKPNIKKPETILENQNNLSFLNNPSNQQKELVGNNHLNGDWENAPTLVVSPGPNGISPVDLQGTGVQYPDGRIVKSNHENTPVGENGENVQRLNSVLNNNEVISQINAQNEALFKQNELLKQQVSQLQQQVSQLTQPQIQQQIAQQTGQQATPEQLQQVQVKAEQVTKKEGIKGLIKWVKENPLKAAGAALLIAGGGYIAMSAAVALSASLTATTGVMGATGAFGTFGSVMPGFLATGTSTLAAQMFAGTVAVGGTLAMAKGVSMLHNGANEKIQPAQPTTETPAPQPQQPVAEQQVQQPVAPEQTIDPEKIKTAEKVVSGLKYIEGESVKYTNTNPAIDVNFKYINGQFEYNYVDTDDKEKSGIMREKETTDFLVKLSDDHLKDMQSQIDAKIAAKNKPVEQPTAEQVSSPENNENPTKLNLNEQPIGTKILLTADNGEKIQIAVSEESGKKKFEVTGDTGRSFTGEVYTLNIETFQKQEGVVSTAENESVFLGTGTKVIGYPIQKIEVVKPKTPESETSTKAPTPSPEAAKSPEAPAKLAYKVIGENLGKINESADELNSDLLKNLHGGLYKKSEPFTFTEKDKESKKLNLNEYLSATAKPSLENLLGVEPSFGNPAEFTPQELINMSLAIENTTEIKDSLKQIKTAIPDKIANYKGDSAAYEVMQVVGENLEIAKEIIRTNRIVEKIKAENTNAANGLNAILKASKDNPIIQTQIADNFAEIRTKVSLEEFSKQLDEALNTKPAPVDNIFVGGSIPEDQQKENQAIALKLGEKYYTPPNN